jgi:hypothetical protein
MADTREPPPDEPVAEVVRDTVDPGADETTQREAVELALQDRHRSAEGAHVEVDEIVDASPAAGVLDDDRDDPPEPSEPG